MTVTISVRLSDEQIDKINQSDLNTSEYTRRAIDYYSENKQNASIVSKMNIVDECIKLLQGYRKDLQNNMVSEAYQNMQVYYKIEENVKQEDTDLYYKNDESVKNLYKNDENVIQDVIQDDDTMYYKNEENVKQMDQSEFYKVYYPYLELMSKMLNIHNTVLEDTKKKITAETNTKPSQLNDFLFKYRDEIKNLDWSISTERIKHDYEDSKKM